MFTGIVQIQAEVISIKEYENLHRITVETIQSMIEKLQSGASIAINGVCLTVVNYTILPGGKATIEFDVIDETLCVTNLGKLRKGNMVNMERSLKVGDEIGGHQVSGHIQSQATLTTRNETSTNCELIFSVDSQWIKYILPKGFITVNGTSLTVGQVSDETFSVHLIPETLTRTNFGQLQVGDNINLECDQQTITIVTTIERLKLVNY